MIICYEGTPGSGKTYDAVRKVISNLAKGRKVYTNIDGMGDSLKREYLSKLMNLDEITLHLSFIFWDRHDERWKDFWDHVEQGSLIVLDEAQNYFGNRDWQTEKNKGFCKWASTHRHYGFDVVLITQDIERIDAAVRALVEWTYRYRKVNFFGSAVKNKYIVYAYAGESTGKFLSKHIRTYDPKIFFCYDSYISKDIKELKVMTHANILKHPVFYAIPVMIVVFIFMFMKSGFSKGEIIPGSHHAQKLADRTKNFALKSFSTVSVPQRSKPVIVEYKDLLRKVNERKEVERGSDGIKNINSDQRMEKIASLDPLFSTMPVAVVQKKVGNVILYDLGDNIITSKDIFAKNESHTALATGAIPPGSRAVPVRNSVVNPSSIPGVFKPQQSF